MKFTKKNQTDIVLTAQTTDDIWVIYNLVEKGDVVSGNTIRKIKIGDAATDRNVKIVKKHVHLAITTEKSEYEAAHHLLRITGPVLVGTDDVQKGEYHSFAIELQTTITVSKQNGWGAHQILALEEATKPAQKTLLVLFDREQALFATLTKSGYTVLLSMNGSAQKKTDVVTKTDNVFEQIAAKITELKPSYDTIVVSSTHFWKDYVLSLLSFQTKFIESSSVTESALQEILRSSDFSSIVTDNTSANNQQLISQVKKHLATDNLATYGIDHVTQAAQGGAIEHILISNSFIQKNQENNTFKDIESLLQLVTQSKGSVHIVTGTGEKDIDSLGGVIAILRYEM